jgi:hypothetical protein
MTDASQSPAVPAERPPHKMRVALLATLAIALGGANAFRVLELLTVRFQTQQLPDTDLFGTMFWIWLAVATVAIGCSIYGGYLAIVSRTVRNPYLMVFTVTWCGYLIVDGVKLGLMALDLSFTFTGGRVGFGINALGIALLIWLVSLREADAPRERPNRSMM